MSSRPADAGAFRDQRRQRLRRAKGLYGLDWAAVAGSGEDGRLWRIQIGFVGTPPPGLVPAQFRLRAPEGSVDPAFSVVDAHEAAAGERGAEITLRCHDAELARGLAEEAGVFEVELVDLPADRFFARAPFRFDGGSIGEAAPALLDERLPATAEIDYLAKDFESFRNLILDRIAVEAPEWSERNPADVGVTLVELLAYTADYLSHRQDAAATEAYLDTARRRVSVRRHLRLVGYHVDEGSNARVWVQIDGDRGFEPCALPAGTRLLTQAGQLPTAGSQRSGGSTGGGGAAFEIAGHQPTVMPYPSADYDTAIAQGSLVFETLHPVTVDAAHNEIALYCWGADQYTVPRGATSVALAGTYPALRAGDVLILEESRSPESGWHSSDPGHRHPVRLAADARPGIDPATDSKLTEIHFHDADALPFPLTVAAVAGRERLENLSVARGNVVLADHGETVQEDLPAPAGDGARYAPQLSLPGLVWSQPYDHHQAVTSGAAACLTQASDRTLPAVQLVEHTPGEAARGEVWRPRRDLLESSAFGQDFVVETDAAGGARLRFGDGQLGRRPAPGARFEASYRLGGGPGGQIGADSLAHVVEIAPDRATRLRWLADAAAASRVELPEDLAGFLAEQPTASKAELEALWARVRDFAGHRRLPTMGEAQEAIRFVADLEGRLAALRLEAGRQGIELPLDVAEQIARHPRCDLEDPARLLARVLRFVRAGGHGLSATAAQLALDQHLGIVRVRNPLPAAGGEAAEPVDRARLLGPRAFRKRRSCVTEEDWRRRAVRHPEVLDAVARHRCVGNWTAVVLYVHRRGGRPVDAAFRRQLRDELEPALLADRDLEIRPPVPLPLEIRLRVEADRGFVPETVRQRILERLGQDEPGAGERGFFHPDNFRFGRTLYLADLLDAAMAIPGALLVRPLVFRPLVFRPLIARRAGAGGGDPVHGRIEPGPLEIVTVGRRPGAASGGVRVEIVEAA